MNITGANYIQKAQNSSLSGNVLPPTDKVEPIKEKSLVHELAKSIDPSNMTRNDARAIGDTLHEKGNFELASSFYAQSMVLIREDGNLRNATESDKIMNEKFNMSDSLKGQVEFNKSQNLPTKSLEEIDRFLQKIQVARVTPQIDIYT